MGRMRSMGDKGPEETVMSRRVAAEVRRQLRAAGWPVTQKALWGSTPREIARVLVPVTAAGAREKLAMEIAVLAGFMPALGAE